MMDSADPLGGWSIHDVLGKVPLAKNDLYGGLYFHVHDLLFKFCERIKCMKLTFVLFQVNALELVDTFKECGLLKQGFDRVEVRMPIFHHMERDQTECNNDSLLMLEANRSLTYPTVASSA